METFQTTDPAVAPSPDSAQAKIVYLNEKGFLWREIAELAGLPKKLIKGLAKGEFDLDDGLNNQVCAALDEAIDRLKNSITDDCPEQILDAEDYEYIKLDVSSLALFKKKDEDKMIIQIHGIKVHE